MGILLLSFLFTYSQGEINTTAINLINFQKDAFPDSIYSSGKTPYKDTDIQILGKPSLAWDWKKNEKISIKCDYALKYDILHSGIIYSPVFVVYLHNNKATDQQLKFVLTDDANDKMEFTFGLNFTGWRTAWIRYTDMEGEIDQHSERSIKNVDIIAPEKESGTLHFGQMFPNTTVYQALPMADLQVPYIQDGEDEHRGPGVNRKHLDVMDLEVKINPVSNKEKADLNRIELALQNELIALYDKEDKRSWEKLQLFYKNLKSGDKANGAYISFNRERLVFPKNDEDIKENSISFQQLGSFLNELALLYIETKNIEKKEEIEEMLVSVLNHIKHQGWVAGHARGTIHNTGYKIKKFMSAMYLMRYVLKEKNKLKEVKELCQWLTNAKECLIIPPHNGDLDYFHTYALEQFISHLLCEDINEKVAWVKAYSHFISLRLAMQTNDFEDGFKHDGTAFHHYGHYPAYAIGAFNNAAQLVYTLDNSSFSISKAGHKNLMNALLQMRIYANKYDFPNALAGRHPFKQDFSLRQVENAFYYLTKAGSIDGKYKLNDTVGKAYMRLFPNKYKKFINALKAAGISSEKNPEGHWVMNNAANSIHRRNDWMLSLKGFSKYVWSIEGWTVANRYGFFESHGAVDILLGDGLANSGYTEDGWDWARLPGTTTMHVPTNVLFAAISSNTGRFSKETFVGGVNLDGKNGAFGMVLSDDFFALKGRKSVFCFDNRIVYLGSNISAWNQNYDVETTIFQNALIDKSSVTKWNDNKITDFPYMHTKKSDAKHINTIRDNVGNTYFVKNGDLTVKRSTQFSKYQDTGKDNSGDFTVAVINHGRRPKGAGYEYAALIQADEEEVKSFQNSLASDNPDYKVLQHDDSAHVVWDRETEITSCIVYEPGVLEIDCLKEVSSPVLIMLKGDEQNKKFSICQPDLKWDLKRSHTDVYLKLTGEWSIKGDYVETISSKEGETLLKITCQMGKTHTFSGKKIK